MGDNEEEAAAVQSVEDPPSQQDGNNESRSAPPIDSAQPEGDSNEQQRDSHDNSTGAEEEDGGVKVHEDCEDDCGGDDGGGKGEGKEEGCDKDPQRHTEVRGGIEDDEVQEKEQEATEAGRQNLAHPQNPEHEEEQRQPDPESEIIPETQANQDAESVKSKDQDPSLNKVDGEGEGTPTSDDSLESTLEGSKNSGCDKAPDLQPEKTSGISSSLVDTSAEDSALIEPIPKTEEQNVNTEQEQAEQQEQEEEQKNDTNEPAELKASSGGVQAPERDTTITAENCNDTHPNGPPSPPPAEDQTPETGDQSVAAEKEEHAGTEAVEVVAIVTADEPNLDAPQELPVPKSQAGKTNPAKSVDADERELPGEADSLPATGQPPVEISPLAEEPPTPATKPENIHPQDPVVNKPSTMSVVSEVSALSYRPGEALAVYQQSPTRNQFAGTGFTAGPLDDEAAAAVSAAALAMSAVGAPDPGPKKPKREKSHKKKDRSSADGTEKVKERKHKDKGDRERAKSRDRGDRGRRNKSELGIGERSRGKSRDPLRDEGKPRDHDRESREKERRHRTPEEKAEREARKAAKRGLSASTPIYADNITAMPYEQPYESQHDPQYEEERPQEEKRKHKKLFGHSATAEGLVGPQVTDSPEMPYDHEDRKEKKSKKSRPPPINIEPFQQQYNVDQQPDEQQKSRKSSRKAAAILGEPAIMNGSPMSPYIDGPIEQPKRKKSSKKSTSPDIGAEQPVHVLHEPDARPPSNRRSRSDSMKHAIPGGSRGAESGSGSGGSGHKKRRHKRKDSAHLTLEEREERRRRHEEKALRKGRELENHLYNGSKEERRAEKAARKAAKAKAEARENIPPPMTPRFADLNLPIQNPEHSLALSPRANVERQYAQGQYLSHEHHRDQQDLNGPNPEPSFSPSPELPFSPHSFAASDNQMKAEKAARRAERRARKGREARQANTENPEQLKDSGHSLSSEGKRDHGHRERRHKSRDKTSRTRSQSCPPGPENGEERRRRKEERREAKRLALNGNEVRVAGKEGKRNSKHKDGAREGGRARSGSERSREKDMMKEMEMGYPEGYGNASQQPWQAGIDMGDEHREDGKGGLVRRAFSRFLKF